jgi:hypothetical protein
VWHGHLARVSWAGRPCHEGFCKTSLFFAVIRYETETEKEQLP